MKGGRRSSGCCAPPSCSSRSIPSSCDSSAGRRSRADRSCARSSRSLLRPLFDRGADFLEREMDAGRLRRYDARQLLLTGYGAVLSYLSDAQLMTGLLDIDPLSPEALAARREHVIDVLRTAVVPDRARAITRVTSALVRAIGRAGRVAEHLECRRRNASVEEQQQV